MKLSRIKRAITGGAFALVFLFSVGMVTGTTAQAQDRGRDQRVDRTQRRVQIEPRVPNRGGNWSRSQQAERAREIQRERANSRPVYTYPRTYPSGGYYGNSGGYYGNGRNYPYGGGYYGNGGGYYGNGGGYQGGYGRNGGGYNSYEEQKGFSDGLNRGQEDARSRRSPNPNNSSHYRSGNAAYRDGFRRGYSQGYRQFGGGGRRF